MPVQEADAAPGLTAEAAAPGRATLPRTLLPDPPLSWSVLLDAIPDIAYVLDASGRLVKWNRRMEEVTGKTPDDLAGLSALDLFLETDRQAVREAIGDVLTEGVGDVEAQLICGDGTPLDYHINGHVLRDEAGTAIGLTGIGRDVTARKQAQEALRRSEARTCRLALVADRTTNGVVITDTRRRIEWVNAGFTRITGYALEEVIGRKPGDVLQGPQSDEETITYMRHRLDAGEGFTVEIANYRKNGERYWVRSEVQPFRDADGRITGFMGIQTDITAHREAEDALRRSEERLRQALEAGLMSAWDWDRRTGVITWSEGSEELFGLEPGAFGNTTTSFLERVYELDRGRVREAICRAIDEDRVYEVEFRVVVADGRTRWMLSKGHVYLDDGSRPVRVAGTLTDVTARKEAERRLRESEMRHRALVAGIPDLVLRVAADGTYLDVHAPEEKVLARPVHELIGKRIQDVLDVRIADRMEDGMRRAQREHATQYVEYELRAQTGREHRFEARINPLHDGEVLIVVRDITAQHAYEQGLIEAKDKAQEMSRLKDAFLANMSHEIRTPLTSIIGFADLLAEELADTGSQEFIHIIRSSGERLMTTLNSVLDLAQLESGTMRLRSEPFDVVGATRDALELHRLQAARQGTTLHFRTAEPEIGVVLDRGALDRVLVNLISNAVKFTKGGEITVSTATRGRDVLIRVEDTGIGISETFLPYLFDSFKQESSGETRDYEGSGLGLAITHRLVEMMNGRIEVTSTKGIGTAFTVSLPCRREDEHARPSPTEHEDDAQDGRARKQRVLVIEDDPNTRMLVRHQLQAQFETWMAANGDDALELAQRMPCDVVLLDINLGPGKDGKEVLALLRVLPEYAEVPVIAMTAYALPGDAERFRAAGCDAYLSKPFTRAQLQEALRTVLSEEHPRPRAGR